MVQNDKNIRRRKAPPYQGIDTDMDTVQLILKAVTKEPRTIMEIKGIVLKNLEENNITRDISRDTVKKYLMQFVSKGKIKYKKFGESHNAVMIFYK
jgi:hypothetical protein